MTQDNLSESSHFSDDMVSVLGAPHDISHLNKDSQKREIETASYELYKEAVSIVILAANLYSSDSPEEHPGLYRNQAILVGLLIRIAKLAESVLQLNVKGNRGEVISIINRCILETAINLEFLIVNSEEKYFDQFVEFSLGPEKQLYDEIQANISHTGSASPIEERMLKSIERAAYLSGINITEVKNRYPDWGGKLNEKLKALKKEKLYLYVQRIPSHMVHGSWVDLILHHLEEKEGLFFPNTDWARSDARLMNPIASQILLAVKLYLSTNSEIQEELKPLMQRIDDLASRITLVDQLHEFAISE